MKTQPGTVQHRIIEHFQALPPGAEKSTAEISEALDAQGVGPSLTNLKHHGLMKARKNPNTLSTSFLWSLGEGVPESKPLDYEVDATPKAKPVATPEPDALNAMFADQPAANEPVFVANEPSVGIFAKIDATTGSRKEIAAPASHFRVGRFSDGSACIESGTDRIELCASEVDAMLAFFGAKP